VNVPLLKTKLSLPILPPHHVSRPELQSQITAALSGRNILVAAPAGYGKTTSLCSWVHSQDRPFGWVSLDENDNDPSLFWAYVFAALENAVPEGVALFPETTPGNPAMPIQTKLVHLINALAGHSGSILLFLDDLHEITNTRIFEDLAFLIDNQPKGLKLILLSRADPPLPLARLRAQGLLGEIRESDLRFTIDEIQSLFNQKLGLALTHNDLTALEKRTEGWAIGLQLAALSLQSSPDPAAFIADFSGSHDYILEYLTDEVLKTLSTARRQFLVKTSILDRLSGPLCDAVLDQHGSSLILEDFRKQNLFISPMDDQRIWYRRHRLFSDLLQNQLRIQAPETISAAHSRASKWYEDNGYLDQAVQHSLDAEDYSRAASLISLEAPGLMKQGRVAALQRWMESLPEDVLWKNPQLVYQKAWAISMGGQRQQAEDLLLKLRADLKARTGHQGNQLLGEIAALLAGISIFSNNTESILREGQAALEFLPPERAMVRARVQIAMGTAYAYRGQMQQAATTYEKARDLAVEAGNAFLAAAAVELLAGVQIYHTGELKEASSQLDRIFQFEKSHTGTPAFAGTSHLLLSEILLERNQIEAAEEQFTIGMDLIRKSGISYSRTHASCLKARLCLANGDHEGARAVMLQADREAQVTPLLHIRVHNLACQVIIALHTGDADKASSCLAAFDASLAANPEQDLPPYLYEVHQITAARAALAGQDFKQVFGLETVLSSVREAGRQRHALEMSLLLSRAYLAIENNQQALDFLNMSLEIAEEEGFLRIYVEAGKELLGLLSSAASSSEINPWLQRVLDALENEGISRPRDKSPGGIEADSLSTRELEVLACIAEGCTNQQIADRLVVSLNTVKKHSSNLYSKLGVRSRTQAVAAGREKGYIP